MFEESKYCSHVTKKHFNKNFLWQKKDEENFESFPKSWICDNTFVKGNVKVRDHCHAIGKYKGAAHRDCNASFSLDY